MKKLYSLLILAFLGLNSFAQCGEVDNQGYYGYFADGSGTMNYDNNTECSWLITTPVQGGFVAVGFYNFSTEVNWDFVRIYDGTDVLAPLLGEFSGSDIPEQVTSTGQEIFITFSSDGSNTSAGFDAYWSSTVYGTLTECAGYLDDGLVEYPNDVNQGWIIQPLDSPDEISFTFDYMDMENCCDFISVYDGFNTSGELLGSFNGTAIPPTLVAYSGSMYLAFTTDQSVVLSGWGGTWSSSGLWYIPLVPSASSTPMINSCDGAPQGYVLADQSCALSVLTEDSFCIETSWDNVCQNRYDNCLGEDGCTDFNACNYNADATMDDGSCLYDDVCGDCGGMGTVQGCMDMMACNYDDMANTTCNTADLCSYPGCNDEDACNYTFWSGCNDGSCEYNDECGNCGGTEMSGCTDPDACNFDSGADCNDNSCTYVGCTDGCTDFDACNYDSSANVNDGSCLYDDVCGDCGGMGTVLGCMDMMACNYDAMANTECNLGDICSYPGCTDEDACNYSFWSGCDDGSCVYFDECGNCGGTETSGCTDPDACNFDSEADCNDNSCTYVGCIEGCTDFDACNYDSSANVNDGSCTYPGCTIMMACNYDSQAACSDGSCFFIGDSCNDGNFNTVNDVIQNNCDCEGEQQQFGGCTDVDACNYNSAADFNDGSCTYPGCTIMMACNYDSQAGCNDGSCFFIGDSCSDGDSNTVNDMIQNNCDCEGELQENEGCIDPLACNFNPEASIDDGSCEYLELYAIIGNTTPDPLTSVDYFYSSTMGSSYVWQASNGAVIAGQGTASVTVVWGELGSASISVTEMSEDGCEGDMVIAEVNISSTSITEISAVSLSVYPNPASSFLIIKSDLLSSGNSVIKLIDSKGKLVLEDALDNDNRLDVSGVANGVYFLRLINDQTVENLRIVIQK